MPVVGLERLDGCERDERGQPEFVAHLEPDQCLAEKVVGLADDEVDALFLGPAELLAVLLAHDRTGVDRVGRVEAPGVADVASDQGATSQAPDFIGDFVGDADGLPVQQLQLTVAPDIAQLLAMRVIGERDHHVGAGPQELAGAAGAMRPAHRGSPPGRTGRL